MTLPQAFLTQPIAHRALHGPTASENGMPAIRAAIECGYGIEIDVQLSRDGQAMVFHDDMLDRLTDQSGPVQSRTAAELGEIALGDGSPIPALAEVLREVAGRVPLLIEIKDQDGALGPDVGALEQATAVALRGYAGSLAVMSFNPHSVAAMARLAPSVPRGLTTEAFAQDDWPGVAEDRRKALKQIPDFDAVGACFVSHHHENLRNPAVAALKARGLPVLCWTIRSPEEEAQARRVADNITFEGYTAARST